MRTPWWFVVLLVAGIGSLTTMAAEKPPAKYKQAMQDLGAFSDGIDKAVDAEDFDTAAKLARSAKDAFEVAESYWTGKSDDAAAMAKKGKDSSADLFVMAGIKNKEGAQFAATEARENCMACHTAHRQQLQDGSFEIK